MAKNLRWYRRNFLWKKLRVNRKYKDHLFRFLFQNKKDLLQLYNAVSGNNYENPEELEKCRRLWEYSEFIAEVNDNLSKGDAMKKAVTKAMESCAQRGVLEDVINKNRGEVLHMLLTEYDEEQYMRATFKEGEESGYIKGEQAGRDELLTEQIQKKLKRGKSIEQIAEELEEEAEVIEEIVEKLS